MALFDGALRGPRWLTVAAALLCSAVLPLRAASSHAGGIDFKDTEDRDGRKVVVSTENYSVEIRPETGATISSLSCRPSGTQMTAWNPTGPSGLLQEAHSADFAYELADSKVTGEGLTLRFTGETPELGIIKTYEFHREYRWFRVRLSFTNKTPFVLSGTASPRLFSLLCPADGQATGREFYCLDRGEGAEILSASLFEHRFRRCRQKGSASLHWIAVTDPAARRGLGIVFPDGGPERVRAATTAGRAAGWEWSYGALQPGTRVTTEVVVVPFDGVTAVTDLDPAFVADIEIDRRAPNRAVLHLLPLRWPMKDVSILIRAYDPDGEELDAYDVVPLESLEPGKLRRIGTTRPEESQEPAWIVPEIRSEGKLVGSFAVRVGAGPSECPVDLPSPPEPPAEKTAAYGSLQAGGVIEPTAAGQERGFLVWGFQGRSARKELEGLSLELAADEEETVFVGLKALQPLEKMRVALTGAGDESETDTSPIPSVAASLWRVHDGANTAATMSPYLGASLEQGEVVWLALTVDARPLNSGRYSSRLIIEAGGGVFEAPVSVRVRPQVLPPRHRFGLWYIASPDADHESRGTFFTRLSRCYTAALTYPLPEDIEGADAPGMGRHALRAGINMLGFSDPSRGLSTAGRKELARRGRAAPLAAAGFTWLACTSVGTRDGAADLRKYGLQPVRVMDPSGPGAGSVPADLGPYNHLLVRDGPSPGQVPELLSKNGLRPDATVWLYLDLRGTSWRWAAARLRSAAWAAAWQGLSGLAVRCEPPCTEPDRRSVLWQLLRDATEEAALWKAALGQRNRLAQTGLQEKQRRTERALIMQAFDSLVGDQQGVQLLVEQRRRPFRRVLRVVDPSEDALPACSRFTETKGQTLDVLGRARRLVRDAPENLHWHGVPLLSGGEVRWHIVSSGQDTAWKCAGRLQKAMEERTGRTLEVSRRFPDLPEGKSDLTRLVWMIGRPADIQNVGDSLSKALDGTERPVVVTVPPAAVVALPADWGALDALIATFSETETVFGTATAVR